jgi:hypothetical protein
MRQMIQLTILFIALLLRLYGIWWDEGAHLHPDERMLIMVAERIQFFSNLNPEFFNYGTLPLYIVKGTAQLAQLFNVHMADYNGLLVIGRLISIFMDMLTMLLLWKTARLVTRNTLVAHFSILAYTLMFFPIQNTHFFVVDVFLNTFTILLVYFMVRYKHHQTVPNIVGMSISFAAALATKFTAIVFLPSVLLIMLLPVLHKWRNLKVWKPMIIFGVFALIFHFLFMPYAYLSHTRFLADIYQQLQMNSNPYIFPYTLQYVGTLPYLYYLKNMVVWGVGPILFLCALLGLGMVIRKRDTRSFIIIFIFCGIYFLIIGRSAVKFMRYMLPLYPFIALFAGYALASLYEKKRMFAVSILFLSLVWLTMFMNIFSLRHTRFVATEWAVKNIPAGSYIGSEHWDDRVPFAGSFTYVELPLYELPDNDIKWTDMNVRLQSVDYIVLASNRLYIPLQKLGVCSKYAVCYPKTADYYK